MSVPLTAGERVFELRSDWDWLVCCYFVLTFFRLFTLGPHNAYSTESSIDVHCSSHSA